MPYSPVCTLHAFSSPTLPLSIPLLCQTAQECKSCTHPQKSKELLLNLLCVAEYHHWGRSGNWAREIHLHSQVEFFLWDSLSSQTVHSRLKWIPAVSTPNLKTRIQVYKSIATKLNALFWQVEEFNSNKSSSATNQGQMENAEVQKQRYGNGSEKKSRLSGFMQLSLLCLPSQAGRRWGITGDWNRGIIQFLSKVAVTFVNSWLLKRVHV